MLTMRVYDKKNKKYEDFSDYKYDFHGVAGNDLYEIQVFNGDEYIGVITGFIE